MIEEQCKRSPGAMGGWGGGGVIGTWPGEMVSPCWEEPQMAEILNDLIHSLERPKDKCHLCIDVAKIRCWKCLHVVCPSHAKLQRTRGALCADCHLLEEGGWAADKSKEKPCGDLIAAMTPGGMREGGNAPEDGDSCRTRPRTEWTRGREPAREGGSVNESLVEEERPDHDGIPVHTDASDTGPPSCEVTKAHRDTPKGREEAAPRGWRSGGNIELQRGMPPPPPPIVDITMGNQCKVCKKTARYACIVCDEDLCRDHAIKGIRQGLFSRVRLCQRCHGKRDFRGQRGLPKGKGKGLWNEHALDESSSACSSSDEETLTLDCRNCLHLQEPCWDGSVPRNRGTTAGAPGSGRVKAREGHEA